VVVHSPVNSTGSAGSGSNRRLCPAIQDKMQLQFETLNLPANRPSIVRIRGAKQRTMRSQRLAYISVVDVCQTSGTPWQMWAPLRELMEHPLLLALSRFLY
jgi:hypothetical protein